MQDRVRKQQFFYNAFRALACNRIDGDCAESGSNEQWRLLPYTQSGCHGQSFVVEDKLILGDLAGLHAALP
jgi:hypothetical protein